VRVGTDVVSDVCGIDFRHACFLPWGRRGCLVAGYLYMLTLFLVPKWKRYHPPNGGRLATLPLLAAGVSDRKPRGIWWSVSSLSVVAARSGWSSVVACVTGGMLRYRVHTAEFRGRHVCCSCRLLLLTLGLLSKKARRLWL
jgi:hypothetical protein